MPHGAYVPSTLWVVPFAGLLLAIALLPLIAPRFWDSNWNKLAISALAGVPVLALYLQQSPTTVVHTAADYVSFMALLASLFVISGGIVLDGDLEATPRVNTAFLAIGTLLASIIGTTGASMLLIRPLLETNSQRRHVVHTVVFFIFLVSNIGGSLTPLGDPPLFLGYLQGVPFTWTWRLAPAWLLTSAVLLSVYFVWDSAVHAREPASAIRRDSIAVRPLCVSGGWNISLLLGIIAAAAFWPAPWREISMAALAAISFARTPHRLREANRFSFHPILEVGAIFAGIFAAMMPALDVLRALGNELPVREPWQFFWATGALSSFLDNAPTYLTFLAVAQGQGLQPEVVGVTHAVLMGISLGAVFMGANTYIGNGPNFMVRAIAESRGVRMPSFGGYLVYSSAILLPVFVLVTLVFLRA
jgi:Na+/H+ antiporter NhaD/arsenite permease-like protein